MKQMPKIIEVLTGAGSLTQSQIAQLCYGDNNHSTAIYSSLKKLERANVIVKEGAPARYRLVNSNYREYGNQKSELLKKKVDIDYDVKQREVFNRIWEISTIIYNHSKGTSYELVPGIDFYVIYQPFGHVPAKLPNGKMAVYTFHTDEECLKVGQTTSGNRYSYDHYRVYKNRGNTSTLAHSIVQEPLKDGITDENAGDWIRANCERYDVIFDKASEDDTDAKRKNAIILNMVEGLLQAYFDPRYESDNSRN